jgi:DNA-binding NarL/FixJ family response regulator
MPPLSVLLMESNPGFRHDYKIGCLNFPPLGLFFAQKVFASGLQLLRERNPDILILDSSMTNHLGLELLSTALRPKFLREIIVLTNNSEDYYKEYCTKLGIHYILDKSFEIEFLSDIIEQIGQMK